MSNLYLSLLIYVPERVDGVWLACLPPWPAILPESLVRVLERVWPPAPSARRWTRRPSWTRADCDTGRRETVSTWLDIPINCKIKHQLVQSRKWNISTLKLYGYSYIWNNLTVDLFLYSLLHILTKSITTPAAWTVSVGLLGLLLRTKIEE